MRSKLMVSTTSMFLTVMIAGMIAAGAMDDRYDERIDELEDHYDERIDELEDRVARLEAEVGISSPSPASSGTAGEDGESGSVNISSSSQSSSSSIQSDSNSYTASYSSSGDMVVPFDIDDGGQYSLTVQASSPVTLWIESEEGQEVAGFSLEAGGEEPLSVTESLEPGDYVLHVEASSQWSVIISSVGDE